jgi:hypothetical protein
MAADKRASQRGGGKGARGGGSFPRWQAPYQRGGSRPESRARPRPNETERRPPRVEPPPRPREGPQRPLADGTSGRWVVVQAGSLSELASALNARGVPPTRLVHLSAPPAASEPPAGNAEWQALVWLG